ncbi:MAG: EamA family transporter [Deinococcales bacterium]
MTPDLLAALLGLAAAFAWGCGDFAGGLASRRSTAFSVLRVSSLVGLGFLVCLALLRGSPMPLLHDALFAVAAGALGVVGLITLYRALAGGQMSLVAPITAVVANIVAVAVSAFTEGVPTWQKWLGFMLAGIGVWLLSRPIGAVRLTREVLVLSLVAGIAFGGIFSFTAQLSSGDIGWSMVLLRLTTVVLVFSAIAWQKNPVPQLPKTLFPLVVVAGVCDSLGNLFFALAGQVGRLDVSAVSSSLYPAFTLFLAVLVLRERLLGWQLFGTVLCLVSIGLIVI